MKAKAVGILILLLVLGSGKSWGQTCANLYCESFQLRDQCEGGNPLPDGATVMIYWDSDANGPDADDPILLMGENGPNFNSFPLNGEMMFGLPGTFFTDPTLCFGAIVPNPPIFFLYVPVPNNPICWISETFMVSPGFNEYQICDWTCGDCFAMGDVPGPVTGLTASQDLCEVIHLSWNPEPFAWFFQIYRDGEPIGINGWTEFEDTEASSDPDACHVYTVRAVNEAGSGPLSAPATGCFGSQVPPMRFTDASQGLEDYIRVSWFNLTGESGYEIWRTDAGHVRHYEKIAEVGQDNVNYRDYSAAAGQDYFYKVNGVSASCGAGLPGPEAIGHRVMVEPIVFGEVIVTTNISGVMSAEAADLDDDGDMDVVAAGMFANKVAWYENNGSWGFTEHDLITGWRGARAVDVGDIDGDGDLDIVAVSRFENSLIWWNKVEWGYWMRPISSSVMGAIDVEVANPMGDVRLMTAAADAGEISMWSYHGDQPFERGSFATNLPSIRSLATTLFPPPLHTMVVSVAVAETGAIMQWSSVNSYVRETIGVVPGIVSCGTTHLNSETDSLNDYYFCSDDGTFGWWEIGADEPHVISSLIESPRDVSAARIDGDLNNDLLLASGHEISWWRNTPNRFYRNEICDNLPQASVVRGLDADGDGDWDVLCAGDNEIRFYLSTLNDTLDNAALVKQPEPSDNRISALPSEFELLANYPNPFNAVTNIRFALPEASDVKLAVFDITGRLITTLTNGSFAAGYHSLTFDANALSSGVYFYRLDAGTFVETRKMVLLK